MSYFSLESITNTAEFKRRKPMSARAKQAISRALKGKNDGEACHSGSNDIQEGGAGSSRYRRPGWRGHPGSSAARF